MEEMNEALLRRIVREELSGTRDELKGLKGDMTGLHDGLKGDMSALRDELKGDMSTLRDELKGDTTALRDELKGDMATLGEQLSVQARSAHSELLRRIEASEGRLAQNGRMQFQQLAGLYRSTLSKIDSLDKHLGARLDATRGAIEALRSSLERQDFRADELARRITALETDPDRGG